MDALSWFWYCSYVLVLIGLSGYGFHRLIIVYLYFKHSWRKPHPLEIRGTAVGDGAVADLQ